MLVWIGFVVLAQFLNAIVALVDKYIVTKPGLPNPVVYAFYVNLLSAAALVVLLLGDLVAPYVPVYEGVSIPRLSELTLPSFYILVLAFISGFVILEALIYLFKAFRQADASDVVPMVSAITAICTFILSWIFLDTVLTEHFFIAFIFLVVGTLFLSHFRVRGRVLKLTLIAGILFATNSVLIKLIFNDVSFSDGFFWTRLAGVIAALSLLSLRSVRARIFGQTKKGGTKTGAWIIGNKTLAGIAAILILAAINLGDVALVNALNGLQFVFLIGFTAFLGRRTPQEIGENVDERGLLHKTVAVILIVIGFFILFT